MKNIYDFRDAMGLKVYTKTFKNVGQLIYRFSGAYGTGDFDSTLFDYDAGILWVNFSIFPLHKHQNKWGVHMSISTVDDGVWQAEEVDASYPLKDASYRLKDVVDAFLNHMERSTKLPSEEELNKFLMTQAMWGEYTG
jgi:hypothetical protein